MDTNSSSSTPVALLAQSGDASERLQQAINEAGGNLVFMADPNALDVGALHASKAAIALVVLEPSVEDAIDELAPSLEATGIELMFEEADVVIARKSWELQRWKRHLAAKLQGHHNVMPTGQEDDSTVATPAVHYANTTPSPRSSASPPTSQQETALDDLTSFDFGDNSLGEDTDTFGFDDLFTPVDDPLLVESSDSILDSFTDLAPDSSEQSDAASLSFASAFDDFSFDDNDTSDSGGLSGELSDIFAQDDLSLSTDTSLDSLGDLTDLALDVSPQSDNSSFTASTSAFDDFSFDDTDSTADSGLGEIDELSTLEDLGSSSLDDLSVFSTDTDNSLLDLASDSSGASTSLDSLTATDDLAIFPSTLDDSDVLNLDDMLAGPSPSSDNTTTSAVGIDESFSGFDSFDSFSNDNLGEDELSNLLEADTSSGSQGGDFGFTGGGGTDSNVAVSVEELMALVSAAKEHSGVDKDKDKNSHLDNKQPQIGGPSGEFEKWGLADPDTVAEVIETKRNDPNRSDQAERLFSSKDLSGVLGSLEARLEDMLEHDDGADDLTIAFGSSLKGGGGGAGPGNHLHGGNNAGAGSGSGTMAKTASSPAMPHSGGSHQQRTGDDLGDPGSGSGPIVVLAGLSGIDGVRRLLGTLPGHFPYPVLIRLKMPTPRYANLAMQMGKATSLVVMLAEEGQSVSDSTVYILPDHMGLMASGRQLYFSSGSSLLESLPEPGNAVVAFSGTDPEQVADVLNFVNQGGWAGTQNRDSCFQPEAVNQLIAAGLPSGEPEALGNLLIQRCGVAAGR